MNEPLSVQPDGLRTFSQVHDEVVSALSQIMGAAAPGATGVETSHGPIASAVSSALGQVLGSRGGTLQATSKSGETISALLQKAAQLYQQGDQQGADTLKKAAEALQANEAGGGGAGSGTAGSGASGAAGAGGAEQMGQIASQVGQQVGQIAQGVAQSVQGLAQGLTQLPQQVMQGVQGMVQSATQGAGSAGAGDAGAKGDEKDKPKDEEPKTEERKDEPPVKRDVAEPGKAAERGSAPVPPPVERAQPAQTRPQQSPPPV
ncbi:ESX-1 secretion-associated protein [Mycolicibacterium sp. P9-64]|uniref:ESX-1 secretion-associated protein n=1 Tax=Mycolicibacterium sp. P9-64 TaxID=2024612 RepID=UPI0011EBD226|nr:ESX-1 secretion-associated protein [Mycolicibacterium sp. P9-64]KAA0080737.1 ESX-1 secretion-associated protein [Mycolicibacterium sp. P9-64]